MLEENLKAHSATIIIYSELISRKGKGVYKTYQKGQITPPS